MIQKVQINPVFFRGNETVKTNNTATFDNTPREFNSNFYVDKKGADAIKAMNFQPAKAFVAPPKPLSLDDYIISIEKEGVPGQDYDVTIMGQNASKGARVYVYHERNGYRYEKCAHWIGGTGAENFDGMFETIEPMRGNETKPRIMISFDKNFQPKWMTETYINVENHLDLLPKNISPNSTPDNYEKYLNDNHIFFSKSVVSFSDDKDAESIKFNYRFSQPCYFNEASE